MTPPFPGRPAPRLVKCPVIRLFPIMSDTDINSLEYEVNSYLLRSATRTDSEPQVIACDDYIMIKTIETKQI